METKCNRITQDEVEIELSHQISEEDPSFTELSIDIMVKNHKAGKIDAVLIDRANISPGYFLSDMDDYSQDTQWIGVVLFEPKEGRTKLKSLVEYDDPCAPFMYIKSFTVKPKYRADYDSDVGAFALRKLFHHPFILQGGVSSAIYVVDGSEVMSEAEKKEYDEYCRKFRFSEETDEEKEKAEKSKWKERLHLLARKDANPFLRNGFFQDETYASAGGAQANILVASNQHWEKPLKSHTAVEEIQFCEPPQEVVSPEGIDADLFKFVKKECSNDAGHADQNQVRNKNKVRENLIRQFLSQGGSVVRSHALHAAVGNNCFEMVKLLLRIELDAINAFDEFGATPLMVAAISAAGRSSNDGIQDTRIIDLLLEAGATRELCDRSGMTAYGKYVDARKQYTLAIQTMMGMSVPSSSAPKHPSEERLMRILVPVNGPTEADLHGGENNPGLVEYSDDDDESDGGYDY